VATGRYLEVINAEWKKDNSKGNEGSDIIPIISKESNQKVGELTVKITFTNPNKSKRIPQSI